MVKTAWFFLKELGHRLTQHPTKAIAKVFSLRTWQKLGAMAVGETVQPTYEPDLPPGMVKALRDYEQAASRSPLVAEFYQTHGAPRFAQEPSPRVSIIVPVYNQVLNTLYCLHSLEKNRGTISFEVIIADDCSRDETQELASRVEHLRVVTTPKNLGFLGNCNNAAQVARGEFLVFLNNDTYVQPGWLDELVGEMDRNPRAGLVGSKLVYPDGTLQEAGGIIWNDATGANYGRNDNPTKPQYSFVREVDYVSGASILVRRSLFEEIGGFDPRFMPAYYEDTDLAFEIRRRGFQVIYQPFSVVVHFEGVSHGKDEGAGIKRYQVENRLKFQEKWKNELATHYPNGQNFFLARYGRKTGKTVLVMDGWIPTFDRDAGGRNTWQYTCLLREEGYRVMLIGADCQGKEPYVEILQRQGIEVLVGPWFKANLFSLLNRNLPFVDYVYLNRPEVAEKFLPTLNRANVKVVYHAHDLASVRFRRQYEITRESKALALANQYEPKEKSYFTQAQTILTVSHDEKAVIDQWTGVPSKTSFFPLYFFSTPRNPQRGLPFQERSGLLFVGGFTHAPNSDAATWFVTTILPRLPGRPKLTLVGTHANSQIFNLRSDQVEIVDHVTDDELRNLYARVQLVVAPLRFGAGMKGKTIEALWHGVPLVGTALAYEGLGIDLSGLPVADTPESFEDQIRRLSGSEAEWTKAVDQGTKVISDQFTREHALTVIKKVFA